MAITKYFITGLLFLISTTQLFTQPHLTNFDLMGNTIQGEVFRFILFIFYIVTWLTFIYLNRSLKSKNISNIDASIAYFASVPLLFSSVTLGFTSILAAPFFILSLAFLFKGRFKTTALFYLLSLIFNPILLIFLPLLYLFPNRSGNFIKNTQLSKTLLFMFSFISLILLFFRNTISLFPSNITSNVLNIPWFFDNLFNLHSLNFLFFSLFAVFFFISIHRIEKIKDVSCNILVYFAIGFYLTAILFLPAILDRDLTWIVLLSLVYYIVNASYSSKLFLIITNLLVFVNLFVTYGFSGEPPIPSPYLALVLILLAFLNCTFYIKYLMNLYKFNYHTSKEFFSINLKKFLIVYLFALNFSLIPAIGTGDRVSYNDTAVISIKYLNPFEAYTIDQEMYPPLSTVIISFFANIWKIISNETGDFLIPNKLSVLVFYILTIACAIKFANKVNKQSVISNSEKLLIILTTFSLLIQTQGFGDVNIYLIPTFIITIYLFFKQHFFLSGILLGITASIKWQPILIIPLFMISIISFKNISFNNFKKIGLFLIGFFLVLLIVWSLVLIYPKGGFAFYRSMDYLFNLTGFHLLSGQALNLNWIVTYLMHIFQPESFTSLQQLDWLNKPVPSDYGPKIFQGYLFFVAVITILIRFYLDKKNVLNFISASTMIFFSHFILNSSAHEKHLFYTVIFMMILFLLRPTSTNRKLLFLFDTMAIINLAFFYGFTGIGSINRLFFNFDLTIIFSAYYVIIYLWVMWNYLKRKVLNFNDNESTYEISQR